MFIVEATLQKVELLFLFFYLSLNVVQLIIVVAAFGGNEHVVATFAMSE